MSGVLLLGPWRTGFQGVGLLKVFQLLKVFIYYRICDLYNDIYIYFFFEYYRIFILNYWFMEYLLNLFRRSNFACYLQVFRPKCDTTFSGFQSAAVQLLHWFLAKWSSVWDGHLMRCIPVVRGCWFRWWCSSPHFEQAHCRYHILCNYWLCSSLSWGALCRAGVGRSSDLRDIFWPKVRHVGAEQGAEDEKIVTGSEAMSQKCTFYESVRIGKC